MKDFKEFYHSLNKLYLAGLALVVSVFLSILLMFTVQFKVEALQDEILKVKSEISTYEDEIQLLEVEWVYLTRPQRLRTLAARYLQDNGYALASQIKDSSKLEKYYLANYQKLEAKTVAMAESREDKEMVSF